MRKIYWRAYSLPRFLMLLTCAFSLIGLASVEHFKKHVPQTYYQEKYDAASLADTAFRVIKEERLRRGIPISTDVDPSQSGLIGDAMSIVTTEHGDLRAKQTTVNPNIAALVVDWLKKIGVKDGDMIAIGMTGSFPALDISVLAAMKTLHLKPIIIVSASASQWGANIPGFLWLDMMQALIDRQVIPYPVVAASLGGVDDTAKGLPETGKRLLLENITHYKIPFIASTNAEDAITKRLNIYNHIAAGAPIKAYINIGGSTASFGKHHGKQHHLKPGLNLVIPYTFIEDSVMTRFMKKGTPVISLRSIAELSQTYNLPFAPTKMPSVGQGALLFHETYNGYLVFGTLVSIIIFLMIIAALNRDVFRHQAMSEMELPSV